MKKKSEDSTQVAAEAKGTDGGERDGEDTSAWQDEYKEFFDKQRQMQEKEEEKEKEMEEAGSKQDVEVMRHVETTEKVGMTTTSEAQHSGILGGKMMHSDFVPEDDSIDLSITKLEVLNFGNTNSDDGTFGKEEDEDEDGELQGGDDDSAEYKDRGGQITKSPGLKDFLPPQIQMM